MAEINMSQWEDYRDEAYANTNTNTTKSRKDKKMAKQETASTKVVTGRVRLSFVYLFEKRETEGGEPRYSTAILIPKSDKKTIKAIKAAQQAALEAGKNSKFNGKIPASWKSTLRDGDTEQDLDDYPEFAGHYYMTVSVFGNRRPGIIDRYKNPIEDPEEVYSGMYARVSIGAFAFNNQGNRGVSFGLNHVQKLADGEPLGGGAGRAEDEFPDDLEDDEDDDAEGIF